MSHINSDRTRQVMSIEPVLGSQVSCKSAGRAKCKHYAVVVVILQSDKTVSLISNTDGLRSITSIEICRERLLME